MCPSFIHSWQPSVDRLFSATFPYRMRPLASLFHVDSATIHVRSASAIGMPLC